MRPSYAPYLVAAGVAVLAVAAAAPLLHDKGDGGGHEVRRPRSPSVAATAAAKPSKQDKPVPHRSALPPSVRPSWADAKQAMFGGATWLVRPIPGTGSPDEAAYRLVHEGPGATRTARVPHGWAPQLFREPARVGRARGVVLSQEGGDSDTWRVYVMRRGRIQAVPARGPVGLGGGFTAVGGQESAYLTWLTPAGALFTRVGTGEPHHVRVWRWRAVERDGHVALVARDRGTFCANARMTTYRVCR
jgi:hypothetical protein